MSLKDKLYKFPTGILWRINSHFSLNSRRRKFDLFLKLFNPNESTTVLDVGPYGGKEFETYAPVNYLERWYEFKNRITALSIENVDNLKAKYPEVSVVYFDGAKYPFSDNQFDIIFSNAVIEHVGSRENQQRFLDEAVRVGKNVFITTPNRWFIIEPHTLIPLLHWLPISCFRGVLRFFKLTYWAQEKNLNPLSPTDVKRLIKNYPSLKLRWSLWSPSIIIYSKFVHS